MSTAVQLSPTRQRRGGLLHQFLDIYRHRDLLALLTRKELQVRYRGSVLGFAWSILNPLLMMVVYSVVWTAIARVSLPRYPAFVFAGMLPWNALAASMTGSATAIIGHSNLVKRVKFPVELIPISLALTNMINLLLGMSVMVVVELAWPPASGPYHLTMVGWSIVVLPLILVLQTILCTGIALAVSAATVYLRDLEYLLNVLQMFLFFGTPILYTLTIIPGQPTSWKHVLEDLNPVYWLMDSYQRIWYFHTWPNWLFVGAFAVFTVAVLFIGNAIFGAASRRFAEEV